MNQKKQDSMSKFVMIIFGASGDLTKRKLMPALYSLYKDNRLPEGFAILGIGRTVYADETYRDYILNELEHFVTPAEVGMKEFCTHLHYLSMDPAIEEGYGTLDSRLQEITGEKEPDNLLFYLATPPSLSLVNRRHKISLLSVLPMAFLNRCGIVITSIM